MLQIHIKCSCQLIFTKEFKFLIFAWTSEIEGVRFSDFLEFGAVLMAKVMLNTTISVASVQKSNKS